MKKKKKPEARTRLTGHTKGKKLAYADLRTLITETIASQKIQSWTARQLIKKLKIANNKSDLTRVLDALVRQGKLKEEEKGVYTSQMAPKAPGNLRPSKPVAPKGTISYTGRLDMTRSGSAYVVVDGLEDDIYIPARYTAGAMNRDIVEIFVMPARRGRRPEGRVLTVVKRALEQAIGTVRQYKKFAVVVPDKASIPFDIIIPEEGLHQAVDGDKVVVKIVRWDQPSPVGEIVHVLGATGSHELEMQSILIHNGFNLAWPAEVIEESLHLPEEITQEEIGRRRDFRPVTTFTIDPITAKDFDDALSYRELENGRFEVGVHIADVSHYVKPGTALDKEAYLRSTSVYLVDRVCPMLPEKLSNELCSLRPQEESLCYAAVFEFDENYKVVNRWFGRTVIFSDHRFSYEDAQEVLESGEGPFARELKTLNKIAKAMRKERFKNGAIAFETDELQFKVDELGQTLEIFVKERKDAHMLVEDFMLLANKEVATYIAKKGKGQEIPFPYRVHDAPDPDKLEEFQRYAAEMGVYLKFTTPKQIARSFNKLNEAAKEDERLRLLEPLAIRTMAKAIYTTDNIGHYGLAFDYYTHFTSPIRRYSDVLVHRILDANLKGTHRENKETLESWCKHISTQERAAMNAERESVKYKQLEFLKNRIGQEYTGVISGVIESGVFVELDETRAEGLVPYKTTRGFYQVAPYQAASRNGETMAVGDRVTVRIKRINLPARQMDLELVQ